MFYPLAGLAATHGSIVVGLARRHPSHALSAARGVSADTANSDDDSGGGDDFWFGVVLLDDRNAALSTAAGGTASRCRGIRRSAHLRSRHELARVDQQGKPIIYELSGTSFPRQNAIP